MYLLRFFGVESRMILSIVWNSRSIVAYSAMESTHNFQISLMLYQAISGDIEQKKR